jgi:hypothetical protein
MKSARLTVDPYEAVVVITTCRKEWLKQYKEAGGTGRTKKAVADCHGYAARLGATYIVGVFAGGINTLVHELTHVCMWEAVRTKFHIDNTNDEALAYLMGNLTGRCAKALPEILEQE